MPNWKCKICGQICADGVDDPDEMETIDEHIIFNHRDKLFEFFEKL